MNQEQQQLATGVFENAADAASVATIGAVLLNWVEPIAAVGVLVLVLIRIYREIATHRHNVKQWKKEDDSTT